FNVQWRVEQKPVWCAAAVQRQAWGIPFRKIWSVLTRVPGPETSEDCLSPAGASSAAPVRVRGAAELFRKGIPQACLAPMRRASATRLARFGVEPLLAWCRAAHVRRGSPGPAWVISACPRSSALESPNRVLIDCNERRG